LVRPSKDKSPQQRVDEILQSILFDQVRKTDPNFDRKVIAVPGDLNKTNMGIKMDDSLVLEMRERVSLVFHCAATVNFNERLDISLYTNVLSVYNLIMFAKSLKTLDALIHVSTAYAHCDRKHIEEKFYPATVDPMALVKVVQSMPEDALATLTPPLIGKRPNTYTFTKSLAEAVVKDECKGMPVAVVRPSVVGCLGGDPLPGWSDNINGPAGIYLAAGHGILRAVVANVNAVFDLVPVDHCINMILAVAWQLVIKKPHLPIPSSSSPSNANSNSEAASPNVQYPDPPVFNCVSCNTQPLLLSLHNKIIQGNVDKHPMTKSLVRRPHVVIVNEQQFKYFYEPLYHSIPAMLYDLFRRLRGKKPMMGKIYRRLNASIKGYAFFTTQGWVWDDDNSKQLMKEMSEQDKKLFNIDLTQLRWEDYLATYYEGCRKYLNTSRPSKSSMAGSNPGSPSDGLSSSTPATPSLSLFNTPEASPSTTPTMSRSSSSENLHAPANQEILIKSKHSDSHFSSSSSSSSSSKKNHHHQQHQQRQLPISLSWKLTSVFLVLFAILVIFLYDLFVETQDLEGISFAALKINRTSNPFAFIVNFLSSVLDSKSS